MGAKVSDQKSVDVNDLSREWTNNDTILDTHSCDDRIVSPPTIQPKDFRVMPRVGVYKTYWNDDIIIDIDGQ